MNYYLIENGAITQSADFRFNENCLESEEEIIRSFDGELMLKHDYEILLSTDEYKTKISEQEKQKQKENLQAQINELDLKSLRALREGGIKDNASGQTWVEYYTEQIKELREQIAVLQ